MKFDLEFNNFLGDGVLLQSDDMYYCKLLLLLLKLMYF